MDILPHLYEKYKRDKNACTVFRAGISWFSVHIFSFSEIRDDLLYLGKTVSKVYTVQLLFR